MTFDEVRSAWRWRPIRNCPGRFIWEGGASALSPRDLAGSDAVVRELHVAAARDMVVVARLADGGLISYRKDDGTYLHTLNTADGLERKLEQLKIAL